MELTQRASGITAGRMCYSREQEGKTRQLFVDVAGGGPVGLAFAILLRDLMADSVRIRVYDRRWLQKAQRVVWRGYKEGNNRRRQVVTLQSNVWSMLPLSVQQRLFANGQLLEVWPFGPDSPAGKGRPRNLRIRWIEDCLLAMAQDVYWIELIPEAYSLPEQWANVDMLAICDGAQSQTRALLRQHFGTPSREFYSINGHPLDELVLGLEVQSDLPDEWTVPLTVGQNRFLFNPAPRTGLHQHAADAAGDSRSRRRYLDRAGGVHPAPSVRHAARSIGISVPHARGRIQAVRRSALVFVAENPGWAPFVWRGAAKPAEHHGVPAGDGASFAVDGPAFAHDVWRVAGGCGVLDSLLARSRSQHRPEVGGVIGAVLEVPVAWCALRSSDLFRHEGLMHQLQFREKSRAWTIMAMPDDQGIAHPIAERIQAGLQGPYQRRQLQDVLCARMQAIASRLEGRMGTLPPKEWYRDRLIGLDDSTLKVLVETGPWITFEVGGDEVSVDEVSPRTLASER